MLQQPPVADHVGNKDATRRRAIAGGPWQLRRYDRQILGQKRCIDESGLGPTETMQVSLQ